MTIRDLLAAESINLNGTPAGKTEALNQCIDLMAKSGKIADVEKYRKGVFAREEEGTTGIGMGIAIPHCKSDAVTKAGLAAMVVKDGVDFESLDGTPAKIIFLIAAPNTEDNVHLQVLSKLSVMLMDEQFTNSLINAGSVDEFLNIIDSAEKAKDEKEAAKEAKAKESVEVKKDDVFIVAVTACPTGSAHTYMAAEAIEKKAKELGYQVKVETRGSGGAKNVLTDDEIANAARNLLKQRGVTIEDIIPLVHFLQKNHIPNLTAEKIRIHIERVLTKREVHNAILTGIELDMLAEKEGISEPLLEILKKFIVKIIS